MTEEEENVSFLRQEGGVELLRFTDKKGKYFLITKTALYHLLERYFNGQTIPRESL